MTAAAYADDIVIEADSEGSLAKALQLLDDWCKDSNMVINRSKSGIIKFDWKRSRRRAVPSGPDSLHGYPLVEEYRYLGSIIHKDMQLRHQLSHIERKVNFVMSKLKPIRLLGNFRLNVNLYRVFCLPLFRLLMLQYVNANITNKK